MRRSRSGDVTSLLLLVFKFSESAWEPPSQAQARAESSTRPLCCQCQCPGMTGHAGRKLEGSVWGEPEDSDAVPYDASHRDGDDSDRSDGWQCQ